MSLTELEMPELSDEQRFWLRLEMERLDDSWKYAQGTKRKGSKQEFAVVIRRNMSAEDLAKRDKIMFHAGRFAAGARDTAARHGHQVMQSILTQEETAE